MQSLAWSIVDLNTLIGPNPALQLVYTVGINDRGEIAGTVNVNIGRPQETTRLAIPPKYQFEV